MDGVLPGPTFEDQMVYRLASLEATLSTSLRRIDEKIDNFQKDFHHRDTNRAAAQAALEARFEAAKEVTNLSINNLKDELDDRVKKLEFFRVELLSKAVGISVIVGLIWVVFGDTVRGALGIG